MATRASEHANLFFAMKEKVKQGKRFILSNLYVNDTALKHLITLLLIEYIQFN